MHEMGHALGLPDSYEARYRDSIMYGYLTSGERRLPAKGQAIGAVPGSLGSSPHFLGSPVNIGALPAGKTVKIQYSVTVGTYRWQSAECHQPGHGKWRQLLERGDERYRSRRGTADGYFIGDCAGVHERE